MPAGSTAPTSARLLSAASLVIAAAACRVTPPSRPVQTTPIAAPTPTPTPPEPPPPPPLEWRHQFVTAPEAGTFAVVDHGTTLHKHPRPDDRGVAFAGIHPGVVKVVGHEEGFVVVDLDWPDDPSVEHCVQDPAIPVGLRMYVREDELADITTATINIATGRDTGIVAAPGVLVTARRDSRELYARVGGQSYLGTFSPNQIYVDTAAAVPLVGKYYAPVRVDSLRTAVLSVEEFARAHSPDEPSQIDIGELEQPILNYRWQVYAVSQVDRDHIVAAPRACMSPVMSAWASPGAWAVAGAAPATIAGRSPLAPR